MSESNEYKNSDLILSTDILVFYENNLNKGK